MPLEPRVAACAARRREHRGPAALLPHEPRETIAGIAALQQDVIEIARRVARSCPVEKRLKPAGTRRE
jgi:hypothetical protein